MSGDLDIPVGHTPSRREAYELRSRLADVLVGLGVCDLYAVDIRPPSRGHRGFAVLLCALFEMEGGEPIDVSSQHPR